MATIIINGNIFSGDNVSVKNNQIFIDGKNLTPDAKIINIKDGNICQ